MDTLLHYLRNLVAVEDARKLDDRALLRRFADDRDEAAFAALVDRHAPLVLAACRRLLAREQDAEDVLQATFLVLVRKAGSICKHESVGSWLYGTAYRLARKARAAEDRERAAAETQPPVAPPRSGTISVRCSTRSCRPCPTSIAPRCCCVAFRTRPATRRPENSAGRPGP